MQSDESFWSSGQGIGALSNLLKESEEAGKSLTSNGSETVAPMRLNNTAIVTQPKKKINSKDIWRDEEIPTEDQLLAINSTGSSLPSPQFEFRYKQTVGTEETFFGLSDKTPGSFDCTHLIIKIHFPNSKMKDLDLDVTKNRIKAESRHHRLFTYLPVNVYPDKGDAKFDSKKEVLTISLAIDNDLSASGEL
jgi:hypothetical protein